MAPAGSQAKPALERRAEAQNTHCTVTLRGVVAGSTKTICSRTVSPGATSGLPLLRVTLSTVAPKIRKDFTFQAGSRSLPHEVAARPAAAARRGGRDLMSVLHPHAEVREDGDPRHRCDWVKL
jgi:hypothetical protein